MLLTHCLFHLAVPLMICPYIFCKDEPFYCDGERCGHGTQADCTTGFWDYCICKDGYGYKHRVDINRHMVQVCIEYCSGSNCKGNFVECSGYLVSTRTCPCSHGYSRSTDGDCIDVNECSSTLSPCGNHSICDNTVGSFKCHCAEGYQRSEVTHVKGCVDIDECADTSNRCGNHSMCINHDGSFTCECLPGYQSSRNDSTNCTDFDKCNGNQNVCGPGTTCLNYDGNYTCICREGYSLLNDNVTCVTDSTNEANRSRIGLYAGIATGAIFLIVVMILTVIFGRRQFVSGKERRALQKGNLPSRNIHANEVYENVFSVEDKTRGQAENALPSVNQSNVSDKNINQSDSDLRISMEYSNHKIHENKRKLKPEKLIKKGDELPTEEAEYSVPYPDRELNSGKIILPNDLNPGDDNLSIDMPSVYNTLYTLHPRGEVLCLNTGESKTLPDNTKTKEDDYSHLKENRV